MAVYKCKTCGAVTPEQGHLCDPVELEPGKHYTCEYCGADNVAKRHLCKPKVAEIHYYLLSITPSST